MVLLMSILASPAFAFIEFYGDASNSVGKAVVGDKGYLYASYSDNYNSVVVCGTKDGNIRWYGLNLHAKEQKAYAESVVQSLAKQSFARFDHFGCLRARI